MNLSRQAEQAVLIGCGALLLGIGALIGGTGFALFIIAKRVFS